MLQVGDRIKAEYILGDYYKEVVKKKGVIIAIYESLVLIDFGAYKESFRKYDIYNGRYVKIYKKIEGEWKKQGKEYKPIVYKPKEIKIDSSIFEESGKVQRRKVVCIETGKVYSGVNECARQVGMFKQHIVRACKNPSRTCKNFHYRYLDEYQKEIKEQGGEMPILEYVANHSKRNRKIYCRETGETFISVQECARSFGISRDCIYKSCERGTATRGYHFEWKGNKNGKNK